MRAGLGGGGVRARMEDQREREGEAHRSEERRVEKTILVFIADVAIVTDVALILLLVNPIDDVLMAILRRSPSALASAPRARRVLIPQPLQNFQVPSLRRLRTSHLIPRARRVLRT